MKSNVELKFLELLRKPVKSRQEINDMNKFAYLFEMELREELADLTSELNEIGIQCSDVWDLVNTKVKYPTAIDILLRHLPKPYHDKNKEGIIRALTVMEAKGKAASALIAEYQKTPKENDNLRWIIGNAIATVLTLNEIDWVYSTVLDKSNGRSRRQMVSALSAVKTEKSEGILIDLLEDDEVAPQALAALGKLKSKKG